ncbi:unnamed protein product [Sphagnum balticum]
MGHRRTGKLQIHHQILLQVVPLTASSAIVALLVYDVTNPQSFQNLQRWVDEIRNNGNERIRIVIVANKVDLVDRRVVKREDGLEYATRNGMQFWETSAKSGQGVSEMFTEPAKGLIGDI